MGERSINTRFIKNMNSKTYGIIISAIIVLVLVGAIFYFSNTPGRQQKQSSDNYVPNQTGAQTKEIVFTDLGFSPPVLTIKAGTTVVFKNNSSKDFWPASAKHPTHNEYPIKGGCVGSIFDACKAIAPGGQWEFKFDVLGGWNYHDHLNPTFFGKVVVE